MTLQHDVRSKEHGLVYVRYLDHVLFNRTSVFALKPQMREAIGWLNFECEDYVIISWDRDAESPTLKSGDPKASGLVLLRSDIIIMKKFDTNLNSEKSTVESEYALQTKKRKTLRKGETATT